MTAHHVIQDLTLAPVPLLVRRARRASHSPITDNLLANLAQQDQNLRPALRPVQYAPTESTHRLDSHLAIAARMESICLPHQPADTTLYLIVHLVKGGSMQPALWALAATARRENTRRRFRR